MFDEQGQQQITTLRMSFAIIFIILAVVLGVWVFQIVNATITKEEKPALIKMVCPDETKPLVVNTPNGKIEFPLQTTISLAYFVLAIFLIIPMTLIVALLKGGVALLAPDSASRMRELIDTIKKNLAPPKS